MIKVKYCLDGVAFGLSSFRDKQTSKVETLLNKGINIRIITMNPFSQFTIIRDKEEKKFEGYTKHSIEQLVDWANNLNLKKHKGKIIVKGYDCMTLDFYWRVDNVLYVGPYWHGMDSQQTITYKFSDGGKGFSQYTDYFERLWNNDEFIILTEVKESGKKNAKRRR